MFVATIPNRNSPPAILLREGYREGGKVKTRTLANLSHWPALRIEALKRCLKGEFDGLGGEKDPTCDRVFGLLFVLKALAVELGLVGALGNDRRGKLALFLVLARIAHQGSRLSSVRWAQNHAVEEVLGLSSFNEDDLYETLTWLAKEQEAIEKRLYRTHVKRSGSPPVLVLYDVTSSYFEGQCNALGEYGYNRDGKKGKKQIVIGLLGDGDGEPLMVRVFRGNTADPETLLGPIDALCEKLGIKEVVFVGDRGMIKQKGQQALGARQLRYITALTDPQIRALLQKKVIQLELFDETACDVTWGERRLVLRKNAAVARKEAHRRQDKLLKLAELVEQRNAFVRQSKRADPEAGFRQVDDWMRRHKLASFVNLSVVGCEIAIEIDEEKKAVAGLLDGCYVLVTDVKREMMNARDVDARYRDLAHVERDFRAMKTEQLQVRPIYVVKKNRTEGHVLVTMLALKIYREMAKRLRAVFGTTDDDTSAVTVKDALATLGRLCFERREVSGQSFLRLPRLDQQQEQIFRALGVQPPRRGNRKTP